MATADAERLTEPTEPLPPRRSPLRAAIKTGAAARVDQERPRLRRACSSRASSTSRARWSTATLAFIAFCAISSAGYFVNDLNDVELDRKHPKKRFRPIAAGELSERSAVIIAVGAGDRRDRPRLRDRQLGRSA